MRESPRGSCSQDKGDLCRRFYLRRGNFFRRAAGQNRQKGKSMKTSADSVHHAPLIAPPDGMRPPSNACFIFRAFQKCPDARPPNSPRCAGVLVVRRAPRDEGTQQMGMFQRPADKKPGIHYGCPVFLTALFLYVTTSSQGPREPEPELPGPEPELLPSQEPSRVPEQVLLRVRARASSPPASRNLRKRKKRRAKGRVPVRVPSSLVVSPPFDFLPLRAVVLKNGFLLYRRGLVNKKYFNLKS